MYLKLLSSMKTTKCHTALDGGMFSATFAERFATSLPLGQKNVSTGIDSNGYPSGSFNKSIGRAKEMAVLHLSLQEASYNIAPRALTSFIALRRFTPSRNK